MLRGPPEQFSGFPGEHGPRDDLYSADRVLVAAAVIGIARCSSSPGRGGDCCSPRLISMRHRSCDHRRCRRRRHRWRGNRPASEVPGKDLRRRRHRARSHRHRPGGRDRDQARASHHRGKHEAPVHRFFFFFFFFEKKNGKRKNYSFFCSLSLFFTESPGGSRTRRARGTWPPRSPRRLRCHRREQ